MYVFSCANDLYANRLKKFWHMQIWNKNYRNICIYKTYWFNFHKYSLRSRPQGFTQDLFSSFFLILPYFLFRKKNWTYRGCMVPRYHGQTTHEMSLAQSIAETPFFLTTNFASPSQEGCQSEDELLWIAKMAAFTFWRKNAVILNDNHFVCLLNTNFSYLLDFGRASILGYSLFAIPSDFQDTRI